VRHAREIAGATLRGLALEPSHRIQMQLLAGDSQSGGDAANDIYRGEFHVLLDVSDGLPADARQFFELVGRKFETFAMAADDTCQRSGYRYRIRY